MSVNFDPCHCIKMNVGQFNSNLNDFKWEELINLAVCLITTVLIKCSRSYHPHITEQST